MTEFFDTINMWSAENSVLVNIILALVTVIVGFFLSKLLAGWTKKLFIFLSRRKGLDSKRFSTYATILSGAVRAIVLFITAVQMFTFLGMSTTVTSLFATAGIGTIAISFGAQNLIRDILSGLFMLWENQYSVGDYVEIGDMRGRVEEFRPRITTIRADSGELHTIPNGTITCATNYSKGDYRASIDVPISVKSDPFRAMEVMKSSLDELLPDGGAKVRGIMKTTSDRFIINCIYDCRMSVKFDTERAMWAAVVRGLTEAGIEMPIGIAVDQV